MHYSYLFPYKLAAFNSVHNVAHFEIKEYNPLHNCIPTQLQNNTSMEKNSTNHKTSVVMLVLHCLVAIRGFNIPTVMYLFLIETFSPL